MMVIVRYLFSTFLAFLLIGMAAHAARASDRYWAVAAIVDDVSQQITDIRTCLIDPKLTDEMIVKGWAQQTKQVLDVVSKAGFSSDELNALSSRMSHVDRKFDDGAKATVMLAYCETQPNWRRKLNTMDFVFLAKHVEKVLAGPPPEKDDAIVVAAIEAAMDSWRPFFSCDTTDAESAEKDRIWWNSELEEVTKELKRFALSTDVKSRLAALLAHKIDAIAVAGTVAELKHYCLVEHKNWRAAHEKSPSRYVNELRPAP
jgi:hypothetical protein